MERWTFTRNVMLAAGVASLLAAVPAAAQLPNPLPPGHPLIGRPDTEAAKKLAPVAPPPLPTPVDRCPTAKLEAAPGFKIELYASGVDNRACCASATKARFLCRHQDKIYAIVEKDGKREVKLVASGLHRPVGSCCITDAVHRGAFADFEDRQHRIQSRQPPEADRYFQ